MGKGEVVTPKVTDRPTAHNQQSQGSSEQDARRPERSYPAADTVSTANFRCKRGIALYKRYAAKIQRTAPWTYLVPSQSGRGIYLVYMKPGEECCSCPDYAMHHELDEDGQETFFCKL
jgi:hypothetical protein